jgi:hypothetical protein
MSVQSRLVLSMLLSSSMLSGCLVDDSIDSGDLGDDTAIGEGEKEGAADGVIKAEVPWTSVDVFAEAGQWGDHFLTGSTGGGHPNTIFEAKIDKDDLPTNMINRISSARVVCGTRAADVFFYKTAVNVNPFDVDWFQVSCEPGETVNINFHAANVKTVIHGETLADKVTGFYILTHTPNPFSLPSFSDQIASAWNAQIESKLGDSADASGPAIIRYTSSNSFTIRQNVWIDTPAYCIFNASGWLQYNAFFYQNHPGRPFWGVQSSVSVSDGGVCHTWVEDALRSKAANGADEFEAQLDAATNLGNYASYYLAPWWTNTFSLNFGPIGQ